MKLKPTQTSGNRPSKRGAVRSRRWLSFRKDERGVTSIEFALLSLPFVSLLFMILELAIVFYINAALDHASSQATRLVRTGQLQIASNNPDDQLREYREAICERMPFGRCEERIRVDLVRTANNRFGPNGLPPSPAAAPVAGVPISAGGAMNTPGSVFQATCPGDVVLVRTEFYHQLTIPSRITYLSNAADNQRVLRSVTAFRNEPFPAQNGATCGTPNSMPQGTT